MAFSYKRNYTKVQSVSFDENTLALFDATKSGDFAGVERITRQCEGNIDLNVQDETGSPCLMWAADGGYVEIVKHLVECGASVNQTDFYGQTPLHMATEFGHEEVVEFLINKGAKIDWMGEKEDGLSPMHVAACKGQTQAASLLIQAGCNVNIQDSNGVTPLHCATANGHRGVIRLLLDAGARINICGRETHRTPLFLACEVNNMSIARMLVNRKANLNIRDSFGMTPLCAVCIQDNTAMASFLIESGAKVNLADEQKSLPIHYTARNCNVELTQLLLDHGSEMDVINKYFEGPLHLAVRMGHVEIIQLLVDRGCDVNLHSEKEKMTALHVAVKTYQEDKLFRDVLEILMLANCHLDLAMERVWTSFKTSYFFETPLYKALDLKKLGIAEVLLQNGADVNTECPLEVTILQKAVNTRSVHLVETVLHCGVDWEREKPWLDINILQSGLNLEGLPARPHEEDIHVPLILKEDVEIYCAISKMRYGVPRLSERCRMVIRKAMQDRLYMKVKRLGLPARLEDFIMLRLM